MRFINLTSLEVLCFVIDDQVQRSRIKDHELTNYTAGKISLRVVEGSHMSMLENPSPVRVINNFLYKYFSTH